MLAVMPVKSGLRSYGGLQKVSRNWEYEEIYIIELENKNIEL